jgi:hypothetical protein
MGQEILIRVDGLAVGRYANQPQLCLPSYNNNIYANKAGEKIGWAAGRIPNAIFRARTQFIGKPDLSALVYDELQISEFSSITNLKQTRDLDAHLVRIKGVHFTGEYESGSKCDVADPEENQNANVFAPTTKNMNFPQSRVIADNAGKKTSVSTSEYAKFAHFYIPGADENGISNCPNYEGTVEGILGFYYDNGLKYDRYPPASDKWAITIRSLDDLQLYDDEGNLWPRKEYQKPTN